jgi:hypothetical protein
VTGLLMERDEVVSNVVDIAVAAYSIERLLRGEDDDGEEEAHEG